MSKKPAVKREAHRPSRRGEIVEAAIRVFSTEGLSASISAVAKKAGMSQASIYYHFPSKEDLLAEATEEISRRITKTTLAPSGDAPLAIREAAANVWQWHEEHPNETRLLYAWAAAGPPAVAAIRNEFVARHVHQIRQRMNHSENPSRLELAVERLAAQTYTSLAMEIAHNWASGHSFAGTHDKNRIVEALAAVGMRMTAETDGTDSSAG